MKTDGGGAEVNPMSEELQLQFFGLELHYIHNLWGRREILRLGLNKDGLKTSNSLPHHLQESRGLLQEPRCVLPIALHCAVPAASRDGRTRDAGDTERVKGLWKGFPGMGGKDRSSGPTLRFRRGG